MFRKFARKQAKELVLYSFMTDSTLTIPLDSIPALAATYVTAIETGESAEWCRCEWIIHPDDMNVKDGACRFCAAKRDAVVHAENTPDFTHKFLGKRMRRGELALDCPAHTKEGFLLYFFQWMMDHAKNIENENLCAACGKLHDPPYRYRCND